MEETLNIVTQAFCDDNANIDKTLRSLVEKQMNVITQGIDTPKDQALYQLDGGVLKRISRGTPLSCSLNGINLDDVGVADNVGGPVEVGQSGAAAAHKRFNWPNIQKRYINCDEDLQHLNLYK